MIPTGRLFLAAHSVTRWLVTILVVVAVVERWGDRTLSIDVVATLRGRTVNVSELVLVVLAVTTPAMVAPRMRSWELSAACPALLRLKIVLSGVAVGLPAGIAAAVGSRTGTVAVVAAVALGASAILGPSVGGVVGLVGPSGAAGRRPGPLRCWRRTPVGRGCHRLVPGTGSQT